MRVTPTPVRPAKAVHMTRGFALLVTIVLVAFLVLILVGLASFTRVETQVAGNAAEQARARQNALFALNVALGQLQKAAGPDQRVTATAEVLSGTHSSKKKWTGVWDTRPANFGAAPVWLVSQASQAVADAPNNATAAPTLAADELSSPTAVRLVGGNSASIETTGPSGSAGNVGNEVVVPLQNIQTDIAPGIAAPGTTIGRFGYWVGDEGVKARINLPDPFAGRTDTLSLLNRVGTGQRSAWELFSGPTSPSPAAIDPASAVTDAMLRDQGRMLTSQQLKFLNGADASAPADAATVLERLATDRFHDYTFWSAGVQADVRNGGLKWDLSTAFDLSDALFQQSEFGDAAPELRDAANRVFSPVRSFTTPSGVTAPNVSFSATPKMRYDRTPPPESYYHWRGPTWHLLRSHYLLYRDQNPTSAPSPVRARAIYPGGRRSGLGGQNNIPSLFQANSGYTGGQDDPNTHITRFGSSELIPRVTHSGIVPYINRIFIRFGVRTVPRTVTTSAGVTANVWAVQLVMTPFVVLHNPYDKPVRFHSYSGQSSPGPGTTPRIAAQINLFAGTGAGLPLAARVFVNGTDYMPVSDPVSGPEPGYRERGINVRQLGENAFGGSLNFKLLIPDSVQLEPGELKMLYPQTFGQNETEVRRVTGTGERDASYVTLNTTPNLQGGFVFPLLNGLRNSYKPKPNQGNSEVNPPYAIMGGNPQVWPNPSQALTAAEFTTQVTNNTNTNGASEIWCNDPTDRIEVVINSFDDDFEMKYVIESFDPVGPTTDVAAASGPDFSSMAYQLSGLAPPYVRPGQSANGLNAFLAEYARYSRVPAPGFQRADDYRRPAGGIAAGIATSTKYFMGLDYYVKAASHSSDSAARPFVTSNPVAHNQYFKALGDQRPTGGGNGTSGFPSIMPSYQLELIDLDPNTASNLADNLYVTPSGNAIWGPHNGIDGSAISSLDGTSSGLSHLPLISLPSRPLTSLAEFQHANIAHYGYQPYFAVGNSFSSPYIPANAAVNGVGYHGGSGRPYFLTDLSYWMNDALWDKFYLSSLSQEFNSGWNTTDAAQTASLQTWATGARTAPNSRMIPYDSTRATAADNLATLRTAYRQAAASLLTLGSFNINSRSVDAWAAVLGAARGADMVGNDSSGPSTIAIAGGTQSNAAAAVPRIIPSNTRANGSPLSSETWTGFAALSDDQIRQLARNIVAELTRRQSGTIATHNGAIAPSVSTYSGPFRSLADFINRNLANDLAATDASTGGPASTAAKGVLQAALDEPTNALSPNYRFFSGATFRNVADAQNTSQWRFNWPGVSSSHLAGQGPTTSTALGYILQADILQQIGAFLSARSDTFTIRTYGEAVNGASGETTARAWCEAVVQRLPEYVDQTDPALSVANPAVSGLNVALHDATPPYIVDASGNATPHLSAANQAFGRKFRVIAFRWLSPQDI